MIKLILHRGSHEIGGSCVELTTNDTRIILDVGMPLVNPDGSQFNMREYDGLSGEELFDKQVLPQVEGLYTWQKPSIDAVLISHAHMDHHGFLKHVHPDTPVYMSEGTHKLLEISALFSGGTKPPDKYECFPWPSSFEIGAFTITPHLVDHSSFSSFAFEIKAEGKRVFYSGDFRTHGHIPNAIKALYGQVQPEVDALIMEGTMLGRSDESSQTEKGLSEEAADICKQTDKAVFIYQAGQNASRAVSFFKAALRSHRLFIPDVYTAYVLDELCHCPGGEKLPYPGKPGFENARVWYPKNVTDRLNRVGHMDIAHRYTPQKMAKEEMADDLSKVMLFVRPGMERDLKRLEELSGSLAGSTLIYSLWEGYKSQKRTKDFLDTIESMGVKVETVHASGHADIPSLQQMVNTLKPKKLIPIHTFNPDEYARLFNCTVVTDSELFI